MDTGIGISKENQASLFKIFGRISSSKKINQQGLGLGLTICKRICERMNGHITVESHEGKGSCFSAIFEVNDILVHQETEELPTSPSSHHGTDENINRSNFRY